MRGTVKLHGSMSARRSPRALELAVVAALMVAAAAVATWPIVRSPAGGSIATRASADVLLNQYLILWGAHALASPDAELAHTDMFYTSPVAEVRQMIPSTRHWKKLLIGYSGSAPPGYDKRMAWLADNFPLPPMLARLRQLRVRYVIVDESRADPATARAARESPGLIAQERFGGRVVYRLAASPADGG